MNCFRLCLAITLALVLGAPASAHAEDELPPTSEFFDVHDKNLDGCVTPEEFAGSSEIFKLLDKDGDGVIKPNDLGLPADFKPDPTRKRRPGGEAGKPGRGGDAAARMERFRKQLQKMDTDKDGRVSKAEWMGPEQAFARMDRNKDGYLDPKDRPPGMDRGGDKRRGGKNRGGDGKKGGSLSDEMKDKIKRDAAEHFGKLDANADGKLTADEVPQPMMLELADANGDGYVTLGELQKVLLQRAMRRSGGDGGDGGDARGGKRRRGGLNAGTLRRWDRDGDGKVSADEFPGKEAMFARLDADGDGYLTEADVKAQKKDRVKKGASDPVTKKSGSVIEMMDRDGDGRLHRAEFTGSSEDWERLDRNRDGWVTADELVADPSK